MPSDKFATYPSLAGKVVVITGGASGIGAEMSTQFASQGAHVHAIDIDEQAGEALAANSNVQFHHCDVTDTTVLQNTIHTIGTSQGRIDVLINNAADDTRHDFRTLTPDAWDRCQAINLKHQFFAAQATLPHMGKAGGGSIVCLGSISWLNNTLAMVGYTTAKAGIHGLTRTLAGLVGQENIRVNALLPGWTMTEKQLAQWVDADAEAEIAASQALQGKVMPADVARMALFLAADDSAMITKQAFIVDGGWV